MIYRKLRKVGNSFVVTIPKAEVERLKLTQGQMVAVIVQPTETGSVLSDELRKLFEKSWEENEAGYRYLAKR